MIAPSVVVGMELMHGGLSGWTIAMLLALLRLRPRGYECNGLIYVGSFGDLIAVVCTNEEKRFGLEGRLDFLSDCM